MVRPALAAGAFAVATAYAVGAFHARPPLKPPRPDMPAERVDRPMVAREPLPSSDAELNTRAVTFWLGYLADDRWWVREAHRDGDDLTIHLGVPTDASLSELEAHCPAIEHIVLQRYTGMRVVVPMSRQSTGSAAEHAATCTLPL